MTFNQYILFLDDERSTEMVDRSAWPDGMHILIARSTEDAKDIIYRWGDPAFCSFDHDLGGDDSTMVFLKWYANEYGTMNTVVIPAFVVHSANPVGAKNIIAFMDSWKRSQTL